MFGFVEVVFSSGKGKTALIDLEDVAGGISVVFAYRVGE